MDARLASILNNLSYAPSNKFLDLLADAGENGVANILREYNRARTKFGPMASAHEGLAVIEEELHELRQIVYQKQSERDYTDMTKEAVQLGAMVLAFLVEIAWAENRR